MFAIEKAVPPPASFGRGAKPKYPFARLEVGDSFFVPGMRARALSNAAQWHTQKTGAKFQCVTVDGGARCWRIA